MEGVDLTGYIQFAQVSLGVTLSAYLVHFVTVRLEKVFERMISAIDKLAERVSKCPHRE